MGEERKYNLYFWYERIPGDNIPGVVSEIRGDNNHLLGYTVNITPAQIVELSTNFDVMIQSEKNDKHYSYSDRIYLDKKGGKFRIR